MTPAEELLDRLQLLGAPRRVLVVEDLLSWLQDLTDILVARGHTVIPMIGVLAVDKDIVRGLSEDGNEVVPSPRTLEIDVVFLDYYFAGGIHNGGSFLAAFRMVSQATVFGMSSVTEMNKKLKGLGANHAMQKSALKSVLLS